MASDASVPRSYHHGNLREALLDEAARTLEAGCRPEDLSLRDLAHRCGVSKTAPYRHFDDRDALLHALMLRGWAELHARLVEAARNAPTPLEGLGRMGRAYLGFALELPGRYRLLFSGSSRTLAAVRGCPEGTDSFRLVQDQVARAQEGGWEPDRPVATATLAFWGLVHGTAGLALEGLAEVPDGIPPLDHWGDVLGILLPTRSLPTDRPSAVERPS